MKIRTNNENIDIVKLISKQTNDKLNCLIDPCQQELNIAEIIFEDLEEVKSFMDFLEKFIEQIITEPKYYF